MQRQSKPSAPPAFFVQAAQRVQNSLIGLASRMGPPHVQLMGQMMGAMHAQTIHVAARLGLADHLAEGARAPEEVAPLVEADAPTLYRLMRALASIGVLEEDERGRFSLTPAGQSLRRDAPISVRPLALLIGDPLWREPWGSLEHSVRTGEPGFDHAFGEPFFEYLARHPETSRAFDEWMSVVSRMSAPFVLQAYDFTRFRHLVDVGGGQGALLGEILRSYPDARGTLLDRPEVIEGASPPNAEVGDRFEAVGGDFFAAVPEGGDLYMLQQIIHDWSDEDAARILGRCRNAMAPEGRVLVIDAVLKPGNGADPNKLIDLQMLLLTDGGRERTEAEHRDLLRSAGLELLRVIPTGAMFSVVEARRAPAD